MESNICLFLLGEDALRNQVLNFLANVDIKHHAGKAYDTPWCLRHPCHACTAILESIHLLCARYSYLDSVCKGRCTTVLRAEDEAWR